MLILNATKYLVIGLTMITLAGAAIGTGILFAGYTLAISRNPEEADNLFNSVLMAFAFIETFVFMAFGISAIVFYL